MYTSHPTAVVDPGAKIGTDTKIWHFSHVCGNDVEIGARCSLGQNVFIDNHVKIGQGCRIQNNVSVYDRVELGDYVFCGPSVVFTNVTNPRAHVPRKDEFKRTLVDRGATLGANATIVCGVNIGRFAFVSAGAVVTKDVLPFAMVMGVPARHFGWMCHCGVKLDKQLGESGTATCTRCASRYTLTAAGCVPLELKDCFEER